MVRVFIWGIACASVAFLVGCVAIAAFVASREEDLPPQLAPPSTGPYEIQLVYAMPADGIDKKRDHDGTILWSVEAAQRWFEDQTRGRRIGFAGNGGRPIIMRTRLSRTDAELASYGDWIVQQIEHELRAQGFARPNTLYLVYYEGTSDHCGLGPSPPDSPSTVGALFPDAELCAGVPFASKGARAGYWETALLHEIFHLLGAVPDCAPHEGIPEREYGDQHVYEPGDLMYYGPEASTITELDIGRDDYFGHGRVDCFDAARSPYLRPELPETDPPVRGFTERRLAGSCTEAGMASSPEKSTVSIYVVNTTSAQVELKWIDGDGKVTHYDWLSPWDSVRIISPIGTTWVLADAAGTCLTQYSTPEYSARAWYHGIRGNLNDLGDRAKLAEGREKPDGQPFEHASRPMNRSNLIPEFTSIRVLASVSRNGYCLQ